MDTTLYWCIPVFTTTLLSWQRGRHSCGGVGAGEEGQGGVEGEEEEGGEEEGEEGVVEEGGLVGGEWRRQASSILHRSDRLGIQVWLYKQTVNDVSIHRINVWYTKG